MGGGGWAKGKRLTKISSVVGTSRLRGDLMGDEVIRGEVRFQRGEGRGAQADAGFLAQDGECLFLGEVLAVGALGSEGFVHVGDAEDANLGGAAGAAHSAQLAAAVYTLLSGPP